MANKKEKNTGIKILMFCGILAVLVIVGCVFFPHILFGWLQ